MRTYLSPFIDPQRKCGSAAGGKFGNLGVMAGDTGGVDSFPAASLLTLKSSEETRKMMADKMKEKKEEKKVEESLPALK